MPCIDDSLAFIFSSIQFNNFIYPHTGCIILTKYSIIIFNSNLFLEENVCWFCCGNPFHHWQGLFLNRESLPTLQRFNKYIEHLLESSTSWNTNQCQLIVLEDEASENKPIILGCNFKIKDWLIYLFFSFKKHQILPLEFLGVTKFSMHWICPLITNFWILHLTQRVFSREFSTFL